MQRKAISEELRWIYYKMKLWGSNYVEIWILICIWIFDFEFYVYIWLVSKKKWNDVKNKM